MGQTNSNRVSHDVDNKQNTSRDDILEQFLNDLDEEQSGKGFSEVEYISNVFVDVITTWDSPAKNKKRTEAKFNYSPFPFIGSIVKSIYSEDGANVVSTITATFVYNSNKTIQNVDVVTVRV